MAMRWVGLGSVEMQQGRAKSGRGDLGPHCQIGGACPDTVISGRRSELEGGVNLYGSRRVSAEMVNAIAVADTIRAVSFYVG